MTAPWHDYRHALGIDLGTTTGWASLAMDSGKYQASGAWECAIRKGEDQAYRLIRFGGHLAQLLDEYPASVVFYEHIERHMVAGRTNTYAAQLYGALRGQLQVICKRLEVPFAGVTVQAVKRRATGKGNAGKADVVAAAASRWPDAGSPTEDEADALWVAECGLQGETV